MFIKNLNIRFNISSFMCNDLCLKDFEQLLYNSTEEFKNEIGEDNYLKLISINFVNTSFFEAQEVIYNFNIDNIYFDQAIYICTKFKLGLISLKDTFNFLDILNDKISLKKNIETDVYTSELGIDTTGYSSEINRLGEDTYRSGATKEIQKLLNYIDENQTVTNYFEIELLNKKI